MLVKNIKKKNLRVTARLLLLVVSLAVFLFLGNGFIQASSPDELLWGGTETEAGTAIGLSDKHPAVIIANIINVFLGFLGIIAVILIMYAGWLWMMSGGEESKITQAKNILKNALIGLVIILSAFAIANLILNLLIGGTTGGGRGGGPGGGNFGAGALGNCAVQSVYPEPNQTEVPRNTMVMVTFNEEVDPLTVCGASPCNGEYANTVENVLIFHHNESEDCIDDPSTCISLVPNVRVYSTDNKTFVFLPLEYIGSPSEYIQYGVYLNGSIEKLDKAGANDSIFSGCSLDFMYWDFNVSNKVDLTPPQVKNGGVFPAPDDSADLISTTSAVQAFGSITVNSIPLVHVDAQVTGASANGTSPAIEIGDVSIDPAFNLNGNLRVAMLSDITAQLSLVTPSTILASSDFIGDTVDFPGIFSLTIPGGGMVTGNSWDISVTAEVQANTITVAGSQYTFVSVVSQPNHIAVGGTIAITADNISTKLDDRSDLELNSLAGSTVNLLAEVGGAQGNNITITSNTTNLSISPMTGGVNGGKSVTIQGGEYDKPRNAVIQVNFNEAMNPITISGEAQDLDDYIRVVCVSGASCSAGPPYLFTCDGNQCVDGKFEVSNKYRTVEFVSNNQCGVNACGEAIYCLPENSELRVELVAANLADCGVDNCASRVPYTTCNVGHCENSSGNIYPMSDFPPFDGLMDAAVNSLDGNRSDFAEGPESYFTENIIGDTDGDSYEWYFFISDEIDITPPTITSILPTHNQLNQLTDVVIEAVFSKIMMSSSFKTGSTNIRTISGDIVNHKNINLRNIIGPAPGYWIEKLNVDTSIPLDGAPEYTKAMVNHTNFSDSSTYRMQIGSGVKDIYQNCFKPSSGVGCTGGPSCCGMTSTAGESCP